MPLGPRGPARRSPRTSELSERIDPSIDRVTRYEGAAAYWQDERSAPATVDGVTQGYGELDGPDALANREVLSEMIGSLGIRPDFVGADVAAGIGRVAKHVLLALGASRVDVIEASPPLLRAAPAFVDAPGESGGVVVGGAASECRFVEADMRTWTPAPGTYDVIWVQWATLYLTDSHLVRFLDRCRRALAPNGVLVLKENCLGGLPDDDPRVPDDGPLSSMPECAFAHSCESCDEFNAGGCGNTCTESQGHSDTDTVHPFEKGASNS